LGAGGNFVRLNGRVYEAIEAALQRCPTYELYHSALVVVVSDGRYTIEQTPSQRARVERSVETTALRKRALAACPELSVVPTLGAARATS
jgi:hypothetical protein